MSLSNFELLPFARPKLALNGGGGCGGHGGGFAGGAGPGRHS
jgi:hypothetical protein